MDANKTPSEGGCDGANFLPDEDNYSTTATQRSVVLQELGAAKEMGVTTFYYRSECDIPHPGARIMELRKQGYDIVMRWCMDSMPGGATHRVGRYFLMPEKQGRLF